MLRFFSYQRKNILDLRPCLVATISLIPRFEPFKCTSQNLVSCRRSLSDYNRKATPEVSWLMTLIACVNSCNYKPVYFVQCRHRCNERPRDWQNMSAITSFCDVEVLYNILLLKRLRRMRTNTCLTLSLYDGNKTAEFKIFNLVNDERIYAEFQPSERTATMFTILKCLLLKIMPAFS